MFTFQINLGFAKPASVYVIRSTYPDGTIRLDVQTNDPKLPCDLGELTTHYAHQNDDKTLVKLCRPKYAGLVEALRYYGVIGQSTTGYPDVYLVRTRALDVYTEKSHSLREAEVQKAVKKQLTILRDFGIKSETLAQIKEDLLASCESEIDVENAVRPLKTYEVTPEQWFERRFLKILEHQFGTKGGEQI